MAESNLQLIKLFSDRSHYVRENRTQLSDLLRPYWKDAQFDDEQRRQMYGLHPGDFCIVANLADADVAVLPMTWNHYVARRELSRASDFIEAARRATRPILSYVSGDEGVTVPSEFDDVWVVRASGYRSRRRKRQMAQPVFFDDPLERYATIAPVEPGTNESKQACESGDSTTVPTKPSARPSVGFCGQASVRMPKLVADVIRVGLRDGAYHLGLRQEEPQPLYPPTLLRARAIRILCQSPLVQTEFIIRSRYRAGAVGATSIEKTTREFYENMLRTDYTLCVRGGGNFSKRLYETLAMGRIPLLVDTDCMLPFEPELNWEGFIVRAPSEALGSLPQRVAEHFARHAGNGLVELKSACRKLWENSLSFRGFHRQLIQFMLRSAEPAGGEVHEKVSGAPRAKVLPGGKTIPADEFH